jgi:hypothetical protein
MIVRRPGILAPAIILLMAFCSYSASAAEATVPSCDVFKQRYQEAAQALELQLPKLKFNREPPDPLLHDDTWTTQGWPAIDTGEVWYGTTLHCRGGKFYDLYADIDNPNAHLLHPTFDLIAAAIYAYTGWSGDKVVSVADSVRKMQKNDMGAIEGTELAPGASVSIGYTQFSIDLE